MVYVALLRGINVGGKNRVEMPRLKSLFESLGFTDVVTYINSGNVIFRHNEVLSRIDSSIEAAIEKEFGFAVQVIVRDIENVRTLNRIIPKDWANDAVMKTDVMFLWDEIDNPNIIEQIPVKPEIETLRYTKGALVWNIGRENVARGAVLRINKSELYKKMTIRNINTVRKIGAIMEALA